jgi:membrane-bound inhibitor of C-type lysozyme
MATPMVVGTASLMLSVNPALTAAQIKKIICATADTQMTVAGPVPILDPYKAVIAAKNFGKTIAAVRPMQDPTTFALSQNYPNPFNPSTSIKYQVESRQYVTLTVYNVLGERVATLVDGTQSAGQHQVVFDGSRYASGTYFYRLQAGSKAETKKMILVK